MPDAPTAAVPIQSRLAMKTEDPAALREKVRKFIKRQPDLSDAEVASSFPRNLLDIHTVRAVREEMST